VSRDALWRYSLSKRKYLNIIHFTLADYSLFEVSNVLFTRALASRLQSSPIIVNCPDPGYCISELTRSISYVNETIIPRTSEEGSRNLIWAAMGGKGREQELSGAFIQHCDVAAASDLVSGKEGEELQNRLWVSFRFPFQVSSILIP
jgi:retinol dehydrogenase 12